jgi:hypothetical protein
MKKIIDISDYFEEFDDRKKLTHKPQITEAKRELNYFNHHFNINEIDEYVSNLKSYELKWAGADVSIIPPNESKYIGRKWKDHNSVTYIISRSFKELSWLFKVITKICHRNNLTDYLTKYHFYYLISMRAKKYIEQHDEKKIFIDEKNKKIYLKNLFDEVIDELELFIYQLEQDLISIH